MAEDLVRYLTEAAHEAAARAKTVDAAARAELINEAEELMALRARLLARRQVAEQDNQLQLPFAA
jgi:hypothetical protein